jgi:hypothetical protein
MGSFVMLEVVIGLVFLYLLLAIICSAITEWIASAARLRARTLKRALRSLVDANPETRAGSEPHLSDELWTHPLIRSLKQGKRGPSYIPPGRFAAALTDLMSRPSASAIKSTEASSQPDPDRANVQAQLAAFRTSSPPEDVRVEKVEGEEAVDVGAPPTTKAMEEWFNDTMERATGWYRRKVMLITAGVAMLITVLTNADTIAAAKILWQNPTVRSAVVAQAEARVGKEAPPDVVARGASQVNEDIRAIIQADYPDKDVPVASASVADEGESEEGRDGPDQEESENPAAEYARTITGEERAALDQIIGWDREAVAVNGLVCRRREQRIRETCRGERETSPECTAAIDEGPKGGICARSPEGLKPTSQLALSSVWTDVVGLHLFGWFLTATAVSIGAPFWFDLLKLLMVVRGSGKKPDEKQAGEK